MTSLFFCCFEKFLAYTVFLPSFIVARHQMAELTWGAFPPSNIGVAQTPSKIGLMFYFLSRYPAFGKFENRVQPTDHLMK